MEILTPFEMAQKAEMIGVQKARLPIVPMFFLAVLAGSYIAIGSIFATMVSTGMSELPLGITKLLMGLVFTVGLILVVVGGAELFTGNNLMAIAWANKKIRFSELLRNWTVVYIGNFIGSIATALLMFLTCQFTLPTGEGLVGLNILSIGNSKTGLGFIQAIALGIMCNVLVCLAVWLCYSAHSTTDKILAIITPITAFVACGFEHSVANMYFIPIALFVKSWGGAEFFKAISHTPADFPNLTWTNFFARNLLPVTIGNIIGGSVFVGITYWLIYLRRKPSEGTSSQGVQS